MTLAVDFVEKHVFLHVFLRVSPCFHVSGEARRADFVAIYMSLAIHPCLWRGWESRFCRYLRESRPVSMYVKRLGERILALCTRVSPCFMSLERLGKRILLLFICRSVSQSVSQSVSHSVSKSVGQSVSQSVSKSVIQSVTQSISQSVSQ